MTEKHSLPAGDFSSWLHRTQRSLEKQNGIDVPCGECSACCTSSYFVHIGPEEARTLARIPKKLLFPAPGEPKGTMLLGYDDKGYCPLFIDGRCSVYENRPLTCRSYDCRLFAAAGIDAGDDDKALINRRIRLWKFSYPDARDRDLHAAMQTAARFLQKRADCFPAGTVPNTPTRIALLAMKVYDVFLKFVDESGKTGRVAPDTEIARSVLEALARRAPSVSHPR
ncbi:MAG: YkgJ family cysteine cluster protein [Candidatus Latescibacterota bacterium]